MNREMMRASKRMGKAMMKLEESEFVEIPYSELVQRFGHIVRQMPDRAWKSNHYVVQLYRQDRHILGWRMDKLMIRRNDGEPIREWHALQDIKNRICGDGVMAVQVFPPKKELIDVANMYWLFTVSGAL